MRSGVTPSKHHGFTLIELLIVVVIIGILASIAIPKYSTVRQKAQIAAVTSDLKMLATKMEMYQAENQLYPTNLGMLTDFVTSEGVNLVINEAITGQGWAATGFHTGLAGVSQCGIFYGNGTAANAVPATTAGVVVCD